LEDKYVSRNLYKFKSPNTVTVVTVCILEWLGRVIRMNGYWKANQEQGAKTEELD
jgi:hypothetical protein